MAEVCHHMTIERSLDKAANGVHVLRRHLDVFAPVIASTGTVIRARTGPGS